jgi:hypothetical protein
VLGFEHFGMQKVTQAMRSIGPVIAKVKLAVIVDEMSDPNGAIAQIDRDFASLTPTEELVLISTEERVASLDVHSDIHIGLLKSRCGGMSHRYPQLTLHYLGCSMCICSAIPLPAHMQKSELRRANIHVDGQFNAPSCSTRVLYEKSLAFGREFGERQGVVESLEEFDYVVRLRAPLPGGHNFCCGSVCDGRAKVADRLRFQPVNATHYGLSNQRSVADEAKTSDLTLAEREDISRAVCCGSFHAFLLHGEPEGADVGALAEG